MPITEKKLPKVIQALMNDDRPAAVTEVKYFESKKVTDSKGSDPTYQLSNSSRFPGYKLKEKLAEFDVFAELDSDQKYLVMHMLGRNRNDVEADVSKKMNRGFARYCHNSVIMGKMGITENDSCIKTENVRKIATTHMKPLMVAVISHLEGKGLPKLEVAKTEESDVKKLIPNWENATKNSSAESKTQSEGLSGFSSLSKKALMALFKASLHPNPDHEAQALIEKYAAIEKEKEKEYALPFAPSDSLGIVNHLKSSNNSEEKKVPTTAEEKTVSDSQQLDSNDNNETNGPVSLDTVLNFYNTSIQPLNQALDRLDEYIKQREKIKRTQYGLGFGGFDKQVKIAAAEALQRVIAIGHGHLTPEHIRALTQESFFWQKGLASCVRGFMSPDAYKDFRKLRGKKEKSIDIACSVVGGKIVLTEKPPAAKASTATAAAPPQQQAAGSKIAATTATAATSPLVVAAAKEAEKLQARPEAFRAKRCSLCEKATDFAYLAWAIGVGAAEAVANAAHYPVKAANKAAGQLMFGVGNRIYQETIAFGKPTTQVTTKKNTTPKPS